MAKVEINRVLISCCFLQSAKLRCDWDWVDYLWIYFVVGAILAGALGC